MECEADYSFPSIAKVMNAWDYTSTFLYFHGAATNKVRTKRRISIKFDVQAHVLIKRSSVFGFLVFYHKANQHNGRAIFFFRNDIKYRNHGIFYGHRAS
jgi:hypothetical protein